jgi:pimeloyl-ACP methyl ester carboxylesterase
MRVPYSGEKQVEANGIKLNYDTFGSPEAPLLLLVSGLGMQMIGWDEDFCQQLALQGYWVIRFDNRDVGLSTKLDELGMPNVMEAYPKWQAGESVSGAPYLLKDMAGDAVGLMDALGIEQGHVVGVSMGGMIVQELLIHFPDRVKTAVSIMSTPTIPQAKPEAEILLLTPPPTNRQEHIRQSIAATKVLLGRGFPLHEERVHDTASRAYERGLSPIGTARQMMAVMASGSRVEALKKVNVPSLVIHGDDDALIMVEGGYETAAAIPNAKLLIIEGMGHSLPIEAWTQIVTAIAEHAQ